MKQLLASIGWVLVGLLGVSAMLMSAGRQDAASLPSPTSYSPSGTAALCTLLKAHFRTVTIDNAASPKLRPGDVAIVFHSRDEDRDTSVEESVDASVKTGAVEVYLPLDSDFAGSASTAASPTSYELSNGEKVQLNGSLSEDGPPFLESDVEVARTQDSAFVRANKEGMGSNLIYDDGIGLTNRFIDKGDNARVFIQCLTALAGPKARIVFTVGSFQPPEKPGLLQAIGPWAQAAWYQSLFLLLVIGVTLNRRFGLPEKFRPVQRGGRELLDAVSDTFTRARATQAGLKTASEGADARLRQVLKLPRDASSGERDRLLPESLVMAHANVRAATFTIPKPTPQQALGLILKLEKEVDAYLGERRPRIPRRRSGR